MRRVLACGLLLAMSGLTRADEPTSIEQFNAQSTRWRQLVGTRLTLEGRCSAMTAERLRMTGCELIFEFADGVRAPRIKPPNVLIVGHLDAIGDRLVFIVTSPPRAEPSDLDRVKLDRGDINVNRPDDWYALADWARGRAAFYQDDELDAEATELYRHGVQAEYRQLPKDDSAGLVALAEKAVRLGLDDRLKMQFLHEAVSREFDAAQDGRRPGYDTVMTHARDWLPGARIPLLEFNEEVQEQQSAYLAARCDAYESADDDERLVLERFLYIEAALGRIEGDADDDGRNGFEIAERIEDSIPEVEDLPEEYRQREIRWQIEHVNQSTREEMLLLVDRLEDRDRESQAIDVRRTWLEARADRLTRSGVSGRLELATEYIDLLGDKAAAVEIYRDLYRSPESQAIAASRLQELGYTYNGEEWTADPLDDQADELSMAIRTGSVREGMTQADVRAVLGRPASTFRFASRGEVVELWVYPGPGVSIQFARRRAEAEQVAIEVFNLPVSTRERIRP